MAAAGACLFVFANSVTLVFIFPVSPVDSRGLCAEHRGGGDPAGVVDSSLFTIPVGMSSSGGIGGDAGDDLLALFG